MKGHVPECIHDHVRPHLRDPQPSGPHSYRAIAPCHDDTSRSLVISRGASGWVTWCCHACRSRVGNDIMQAATRRALIADGAPESCLLRPAAEARTDVDEIEAIVFGGGSRTAGWLRIAAILRGYDGLPHGDELVALAEDCGTSRRAAFDALKAGGELHPTTSTEHSVEVIVKPRRSA